MKFEYWQAAGGQWFWHLKAANGEKVASGEGYARKEGCLAAIDLVRGSSKAPATDVSR